MSSPRVSCILSDAVMAFKTDFYTNHCVIFEFKFVGFY